VDGQSGVSALRDHGPYPVIFGQCGSELFTLLDVHTEHATGAFGDRPERHVLSPARALRGNVRLTSSAEPEIDGVRLLIDYLLFFSQLSVFEHTDYPGRTIGSLSSTASARPVPQLDARWQDVTISLAIEFSDFWPSPEDPNTMQMMSRERASLDL